MKLHFYDDQVFDMANFISVPARLGDEEQAFLLAAFEITKRLEKRQDIRLTAEDREAIKKAIVGELAASWLARGEGKIDAKEMEDVRLLLEGSHIPDATLEELLKRHMLVSEDGVTRANKAGRSQYMNYATML